MATAKNTSLSINLVMNSAINGANFLQASVNSLVKPAQTLQKIELLKSTRFPLLKKNLNSLENHLGKIRSTTSKISANPIKLDVKSSRDSLKEARKDMTAIEHDAKQVAFWTKKAGENLSHKSMITSSVSPSEKASFFNSKRKIQHAVSPTTAIATSVTVASVLTLPFKSSIDFESKMARVRALSGATDKEFKALTTTALNLGKSTEWSAGNVAEGMQYLSMAGFNAKETISAMPGLLNLATAGATDLATTSDIASNIMGGFDIDPTKTINGMNAMSYVSDIMAKTITSANVDMRMLGDTMKYVAPVAKTAGMSLEETSAMAGLLGNIGIQGSMAGTTLKSMILRLASPTGAARKELESLGISALTSQGNIRSMPSLLKDVAKATADMGSGDRLSFIKKVFGVEPAAGINKLIEQSGSGALDKYLSVVNEYKGSAKKIADIQLASTAGQFKLLSSAMEGLNISATTGLLPTIKTMTNGLTSVASSLSTFTAKYPEASKWVFGLGAAFVAGSVALAGFGFVASGVATALGFISLPVVAIVAGLSALAYAGVTVYKNWETIKQKASKIWSDISASVKEPFVGVFEYLESKFLKVMQVKNSISSFFGFGDEEQKSVVPGIKQKELQSKLPRASNNIIKSSQKEKSFFEKTSELFSFKSEQKSVVPGIKQKELQSKLPRASNNIIKSSLLQETKIEKVVLPSVSQETQKVVNDSKSYISSNEQNSSAKIEQNITNHITIKSVDGKIDEQDLYEKLKRVQKRIAREEADISLLDIA